jgi:hypothetical protein
MKVKFVIAYSPAPADTTIKEGTIAVTQFANEFGVFVDAGKKYGFTMPFEAFNTCCREIADVEELPWIQREQELKPKSERLCVN